MHIPHEPTLVIDYLFEMKLRHHMLNSSFPVYLKKGEMLSWEGVPVTVIAFPISASMEDTTMKNLRQRLIDIPDSHYTLFDQQEIIQGALHQRVEHLDPAITQYEPLITPR